MRFGGARGGCGGDAKAGGWRRATTAGDAVIDFLAAPQGDESGGGDGGGAGGAARRWARGRCRLRLLAHYAASVEHRQYRANDLVTVRVEEVG